MEQTPNVFLNHGQRPTSWHYKWKECHKGKITTVAFIVFHKVIFLEEDAVSNDLPTQKGKSFVTCELFVYSC